MPSCLTVAQLADRWQVTDQHIYNLEKGGKLPSFRVGTLIRFRVEDVEAYECQGHDHRLQPIPSSVEATAGMSNGGRTVALNAYRAALRTKQKRGAS